MSRVERNCQLKDERSLARSCAMTSTKDRAQYLGFSLPPCNLCALRVCDDKRLCETFATAGTEHTERTQRKAEFETLLRTGGMIDSMKVSIRSAKVN